MYHKVVACTFSSYLKKARGTSEEKHCTDICAQDFVLEVYMKLLPPAMFVFIRFQRKEKLSLEAQGTQLILKGVWNMA